MTKMKLHILHTGKVSVSPGLPFKDTAKYPTTKDLLADKQRLWLPVSAYLIEHPQGLALFDTGWSREIAPRGDFDREAQIRHMTELHFTLGPGELPLGESAAEQLAAMGIKTSQIDYVVLSHLHTDHASALRDVRDAQHIIVSREEWQDTLDNPRHYASDMWRGVDVQTFDFAETGIGPVGRSFDLFGDGRIQLVHIPGHTNGLCAMKLTGSDGRFILLFADGGYDRRSWEQMIPPGTSLNEEQLMQSLQLIREQSLDANCTVSLANHEMQVPAFHYEL